MDRKAQRAAKNQRVAQIQAGQSWQAAATSVDIQTSQDSAYHLLRRALIEGDVVLEDQRHRHLTNRELGYRHHVTSTGSLTTPKSGMFPSDTPVCVL